MEVDWAFVVLIIIAGLRVCLGGRRVDAIQKPLPVDYPFPCLDKSLWRSKDVPKSVHALRPGDIDVIGAIGDSLTAANGAMADNLYDAIFRENRGVSWSAGGQGDWRKYLTVPNLLKVMNPNLVGFSTADGRFPARTSQFNMAFVGAMDQDLMLQATKLVARMKNDRRVDFQNHWKMVTVMIGTNDVCTDTCYYDIQGPEMHRRTLQNLLEFLRNSVPRVLIHLVSMPYVPDYATMVDPPFATCITMQLIDCLCLFGGEDPQGKLANVTQMTLEFQQVEKEVAESWKNEASDDFAVVYQPTNLYSRFPNKQTTKTSGSVVDLHDYSYVAIDCIHFSQKLHAAVANTFWNNLFEVPGNKTSKWVMPAYSKFLCPTLRQPFIATTQNSASNLNENIL